MPDYGAYSFDEGTPLLRAFVDAFSRSASARQALHRPDDEPSAPAAPADNLAEQLGAITRRLARDAMAWTGAAGETDIADAQYAFVALLDELLLFSEWPGQAAWEAEPLEMRVFGMRSAGERLPDAMEALLARRDASQRDLAKVYLACLMLGFRGRLRGQAGALRHDQLRHALFAFAMQRDAEPARLTSALERHAVPDRNVRSLVRMVPDNARFAGLIGIGAGVLLAISHLLWLEATAVVRPSLEQFQAVALADPAPARASGKSTSGAVAPDARRQRVHARAGDPTGTAGPLPGDATHPDVRSVAQSG
jgi:type VI secretion system protein ImpK